MPNILIPIWQPFFILMRYAHISRYSLIIRSMVECFRSILRPYSFEWYKQWQYMNNSMQSTVQNNTLCVDVSQYIAPDCTIKHLPNNAYELNGKAFLGSCQLACSIHATMANGFRLLYPSV